jgi:cytochrome c556
MKTRKHAMVPAVASLLVLLMGGAAAPGMAQTPTPAKTPQHQEGMKGMKGMQGMQGMSGMMGEPHQVLVMAYRDNLATFAQALRGHVNHSETVNLDLARPAVAEMRRSFDQMQQHHQAQMTRMGDSPKPAMSEAMTHMETHLTALAKHLSALEAEVNASTPDPKKVSEHASEILKNGAGMSMKPPKDKPTM